MLQEFVDGLEQNLTPEEFARLDALVTPEIATLLAKGIPELAPLFQAMAEDSMGGGPELPPVGGGGMPSEMGQPAGAPSAMKPMADIGANRHPPEPDEFVPRNGSGDPANMFRRAKMPSIG